MAINNEYAIPCLNEWFNNDMASTFPIGSTTEYTLQYPITFIGLKQEGNNQRIYRIG